MYFVVFVSLFKGMFWFYLFSQLSNYFHTWFYIFFVCLAFLLRYHKLCKLMAHETWIDPCVHHICQGRCCRCHCSPESSCWENLHRASPLEPLPHKCEHRKISRNLCHFDPWLTELSVSPSPPFSYLHFSLFLLHRCSPTPLFFITSTW